jgi:hypothetical protein
VRCAAKLCAVYTENAKPDYMDSYFFSAMFSEERTALFAAAALTKLAQACQTR